jgi:hypothetical protein
MRQSKSDWQVDESPFNEQGADWLRDWLCVQSQN